MCGYLLIGASVAWPTDVSMRVSAARPCICQTWSLKLQHCFTSPGSTPRRKIGFSGSNWIPIVHGHEVYAVHTLSPFRVLRVAPDGKCSDYDGASVAFQGLTTELRGSSAARRLPQAWLVAGHVRRGEAIEYQQRLLLLASEPPFRPLAATPPFVFEGANATATAALAGFHFLNDIVPLGEEILFCVGVGDRDGVVVAAPLAATLARLRQV